jgi:hypothetical protein
MRLDIAVVAMLIAAATPQLALASVFAQGEADVVVAAGEDDPALEWDIDVAGGSPSTDHITLAPIAVGFQGEFTVAIAGTAATVTLTTLLPADEELVSVGCLDDLTPPTEITPLVDRSSFTLDVAPGRRYRCFVSSLPSDLVEPGGPPAATTQRPTDRPLPRSDSSMTPASPLSPGWRTVLVTIIAICGIALLLRPVRR